MIFRIWALVLKELQNIIRNRQSLALIIVPVIIQVLLFPFACTLEVKNNTLGVYNKDLGKESLDLVHQFLQSKVFTRLLIINNQEKIKDVINSQKALVVVVFPKNFSIKLKNEQNASLQVILDGRRSNAAQIAFSFLKTIINNYQIKLMSQYQSPLSTISIHNWFNPNLNYRWFILPSLIGLITTIGCLIVTTISIAREREQGTFDQLLASPLLPFHIIIGKIIPAIIIALLQATIILAASIFIYRIPFQGSIFLLYFCLIVYGLSLAGVGIFISSISVTQQQALLGTFAFLVSAVILSGYLSPIKNMAQPLQLISWFNPLRHFIVIGKGIYLKDFTLAYVLPHLWPLLIISFLTLTTAYFIFKKHTQE